MTAWLLASVAGLAVLDMLSPTTIVVTLLVLLRGDPRVGRLLVVYWATVAGAYVLLGVVLVLGLAAAFDVLDSTVGLWIRAGVGVALLVGSFFIPERTGTPVAADAGSSTFTPGRMVGLGLATWTLEAATAVPYVAATALIASAGLPAVQWLPIIVAYTLLMLAPCVVLLALWRVAGGRVQARLQRWYDRLATASNGWLPWIVGIAGFLLARDAVARLFSG